MKIMDQDMRARGQRIIEIIRMHAPEFIVGLMLMGIAGFVTFSGGAAAWAYSVRISIVAMEKDIRSAISGIEQMRTDAHEFRLLLRENEKDLFHQSERLGRVETIVGANKGGG